VRYLIALAFAAGCAHGPRKAERLTMEPIVFEAQKGGQVQVVDAQGLFEKAGAAFGEKLWDDALGFYDQLLERFPDSKLVVPTLYNSGLTLENKGDLAGATERYKRLIARKDVSSSDMLDALYRLGNTYGELKNHTAAAALYAQILERKDLSLSDRLEAMARRGVAQYHVDDFGAAERTLREQIAYFRQHQAEERIDTDFFVGMSAYYIGEIAHAQYKKLPIRLPEKRMSEDLEAKARMLLVAQARFIETMKMQNAEWATAAGFQIASLYREFYDDLVGAPVPPELDGEHAEVYRDEVKKKVRTLLEKAISVHERNLIMAERVGIKNDWVRRSNEQMDQLRKILVPPQPGAPTDLPPPPAAPPLPVPKPRNDARPTTIM
jgi:tetratricopeptide (TPR) repeat protein